MKKPQRLRQRRTKGWTLPAGARFVGRPTIFGNPFAVAEYGQQGAVDLYRRFLDGELDSVDRQLHRIDRFSAELGDAWLPLAELRLRILDRVPELRGHDLSCWCRPEAPCHADVLLELANP